jgi:hypothetical protein
MKTYWGVDVELYALTSVLEASGQLHSPAALSQGYEAVIPIGQQAGWPRSQSGRSGE